MIWVYWTIGIGVWIAADVLIVSLWDAASHRKAERHRVSEYLAKLADDDAKPVINAALGDEPLYRKCVACDGHGDRYDDDAPWGTCAACGSSGMVQVWPVDD